VVSLLEPGEARMLGLAKEEAAAQKAGMRFVSFPIPDVHVPQDEGRFRTFVTNLAERLRAGEKMGMHCRGSIGRATVTAACTLIHLGWTAADALKAIEKARGLEVPDTEEQRRWILSYKAEP
jgi:protein-tyrosine phosphatase